MWNSRLTLTYDNEMLQDGTCAQLQRILGISGLAYFMKIGYVHSRILWVSPNSCDPFQTKREINKYVEELNRVFELPDTNYNLDFDKVIKINYLTPINLTKYIIRAYFTQERILLKIFSPYWFTNKFPSLYKKSVFRLKSQKETRHLEKNIVVHLRFAGIMKEVPTPKYAIDRVLSESFFIKIIDGILQNEHGTFKIRLHVDSPREDMLWSPPKDQIIKDIQLGFHDSEKILIKGFKIENSDFSKYEDVDVIYGISPLDALNEMRNAHYLIASLSSFSFVGGLLNENGEIFFPSTFVSKGLKKWHSI